MSNNSSNTCIIKNKSIASWNEVYKLIIRGDLEVARQLGVKLPKWESQYERLYTDTKDCLKKLSRIYKIGVIANQSLGTSERLGNLQCL